MPTTTPAADTARTPRAAPRAGRPGRWGSLDVLKGLALWAMVAHHVQKWIGGDVDARFWGFDHFLPTDLAAPAFAVALGAAAVVVGARAGGLRGLVGPVRRWTEIFALGVGLDAVVHRGLEVPGVLPTLAVLGLVVTVAVAAGLRSPWAWWAIAAACVVVAVPATEAAGEGWWAQLVGGTFSLVVYGVFAAAGAAVACHALGRDERALPLWTSAAGVLVAGLLAAAVAGGVVSPEGVWPPARYPGHLGFTLWGLVGTLVVWALARALLRTDQPVGAAVALAGQRTLLVFAAHFAVKLALQAAGVFADLHSHAWGLAGWALVLAICAASTIRTRRVP